MVRWPSPSVLGNESSTFVGSTGWRYTSNAQQAPKNLFRQSSSCNRQATTTTRRTCPHATARRLRPAVAHVHMQQPGDYDQPSHMSTCNIQATTTSRRTCPHATTRGLRPAVAHVHMQQPGDYDQSSHMSTCNLQATTTSRRTCHYAQHITVWQELDWIWFAAL